MSQYQQILAIGAQMQVGLIILYVLAVFGVIAAILYGWARQPTPQTKEAYTMKWLDFVKAIAPIAVSTLVPGGAVLAPFIVTGIDVAEKASQAGPLTGPQKLALATTEVVNAAQAAATQTTKVDPAQISAVISHVVDTANAVEGVVDTAQGNK